MRDRAGTLKFYISEEFQVTLQEQKSHWYNNLKECFGLELYDPLLLTGYNKKYNWQVINTTICLSFARKCINILAPEVENFI